MLTLGVLFAILSFLGWGIADFLAKRVVDRVGALWSLLIMQIIGIIPIFLYTVFFLNIPLISTTMIGILGISAFFLICGYLFFYKAVKHGPLSVVSPIAATGTTITVIVSVLFFSEVLSAAQIFAIFIIYLGIVLAAVNWDSKIKKTAIGVGVVFAILTMLQWGIAFPLMKVNMNIIGPIMTLLIVRFFSIIFLSLYAAASKNRPSIGKQGIWIYLILIGIVDALSFLAYYIGVSMDYLSIVSPVSSAYPAVTIVLAYIFLKERIANTQKAGIFLILAGLILISII